METKEQKIERLKADIKSIRDYLNSFEKAGIPIVDDEVKQFFAYRILVREQELKELEDDGRNSKN